MGRETRGREGERKRKRERETTNLEGEGERWTRGWKGGDGGATTRLRAADGYREVRGGGEYVDSPEGRGVIEATSLEGRAGEGRQRIGSRGKLAAGNSRLDSTRLNSPVLLLLVLSLFRSHRRSPFSPSLATRNVYWCIGARFKPLRAVLRVHTDVCIQGGAFSHDPPRHPDVSVSSSDHRSREISPIFVCLVEFFTSVDRSHPHASESHTYENGEMRFARFHFVINLSNDRRRYFASCRSFNLFFLFLIVEKFKVNLLSFIRREKIGNAITRRQMSVRCYSTIVWFVRAVAKRQSTRDFGRGFLLQLLFAWLTIASPWYVSLDVGNRYAHHTHTHTHVLQKWHESNIFLYSFFFQEKRKIEDTYWQKEYHSWVRANYFKLQDTSAI